MNKLLVVVDMQNDFIDEALGTKEAVAIVPNVVNKILNWKGDIIVTRDTHSENYLESREGKYLPIPHCINGTHGHKINDDVKDAIDTASKNGHGVHYIDKPTFGSTVLAGIVKANNYDYVELIGLCTDICVVSNALLIKANCPEMDIAVDKTCCAGVTPETHKAALDTMKMCQIDIIGE